MKITRIQGRVLYGGPLGLLLIGDIIFDDALRVNGVQLWQDKRGAKFIQYPSKGARNSFFHPVIRELYDDLLEAVSAEYDKLTASQIGGAVNG